MRKTGMSRNSQRATSFDDLPHELAFYIFVRVPVKTLIRSSAVSKTWYSLVKSPDFVSAHITRSISSCNKDAVLIIPFNISDQQKYCSLISADTGLLFDKYEIPFTTMTHSLKLVGSVHGLVCFTDDYISRPYDDDYRFTFPEVFRQPDHQNLFMWNPSVRKYKCIVSSCFKKRYAYQVRYCCALGFGFHEPSNDYRVVRIMYFNDHRGNQFGKLTPRVEVFSLRMNKWRPWREIKNRVVPRVASKIGTTVGSTVYWLKERRSMSEGVRILSFDFNSEVFRQIKLPDDVCYSLGEVVNFQLMKFEGSLSVCVCKRGAELNGMLHQPCYIWLISREDGIVSFTMRFTFVLEKVGHPLNITKDGALLMASLSPGSTTSVLSCDLKSVHYKYLEIYKSIGNAQPPNVDTFFIESLGGDELLTSVK